MVIFLVACSYEDVFFDKNISLDNTETRDSVFTYTMHLNAEAPVYDGASDTRSSASWEDGNTVCVKFKNTYGTAVYNKSSNLWTVTTKSSLTTTTNPTECYGVYVENVVSETSERVNLSALSPYYYGTGIYTYTSSTGIIATINLEPRTWRLRFKGVSGTEVTVSSGDVKVYKYFRKDFNSVTEDLSVTLTVGNDGYTPYIYGRFSDASSDNEITVTTTDGIFTRSISGEDLGELGGSVCMDVPTGDSHKNWEMVQIAPNCAVKPDFYWNFTTDFVTTFSFDDNVSYFYYYVLSEDDYNQFYSKNQVADYIESLSNVASLDAKEYKTYEFCQYQDALVPNSNYCLISFGYNSNGARGEITVTPFTTGLETDAIAEITKIETLSDCWSVYVTLKNNAANYYYARATFNNYDTRDCFVAFDLCYFVAKYYGAYYQEVKYTNLTYSFGDYEYIVVATLALNKEELAGNTCVARTTKSASFAQRTNYIGDVPQRATMRKIPEDLRSFAY